jgi:hypothetical protein
MRSLSRQEPNRALLARQLVLELGRTRPALPAITLRGSRAAIQTLVCLGKKDAEAITRTTSVGRV